MGKNQHYVPKMYLKNFTMSGDAERCYEYNRHSRKIERKSIDKLCSAHYLYEIRDDEGQFLSEKSINKLEELFSKIESEDAIKIQELISTFDASDENSVYLSNDKIEFLIGFIYLLILRNKTTMELFPDVYKELYGKEIKDKASKKLLWYRLFPELLEYKSSNRLIEIEVMYAGKGESFITSSFPFYFWGGLGDDIYIPISSKYAVIIKKAKCLVRNFNMCKFYNVEDNIDYYNGLIAYANVTSLIGCDKRLVQKWVNASTSVQ